MIKKHVLAALALLFVAGLVGASSAGAGMIKEVVWGLFLDAPS